MAVIDAYAVTHEVDAGVPEFRKFFRELWLTIEGQGAPTSLLLSWIPDGGAESGATAVSMNFSGMNTVNVPLGFSAYHAAFKVRTASAATPFTVQRLDIEGELEETGK